MDHINSPSHYRHLDVECIDVAEHFNYCMGNALKYIWRADYKGRPLDDLKKARWYIDREIKRREKPFAPSQKIEGRHSGNVIGGSREPTPAEVKEMKREGKL